MNKELYTILSLYEGLISTMTEDGIPVELRSANVVGTVQDDPFDCWVEEQLKKVLPEHYEVYHAGKLTTPDLIIQHLIESLDWRLKSLSDVMMAKILVV